MTPCVSRDMHSDGRIGGYIGDRLVVVTVKSLVYYAVVGIRVKTSIFEL
jgi:hypothetical protein